MKWNYSAMWMEQIIAAILGAAIGVFTGIVPGVHVNLVCSLLLSMFVYLPFSGGADVVAFIVALAVCHTFLDMIPSVFLGAPSEATALGVLPGHRYLLAGNGLMAVKLSTFGALGGLLLGLLTFPVFSRFTVLTEMVPKIWIGWILAIIPVIMWLRDKKKLAALAIIVLSAAYGFVGFQFPNPLFPMLSGMFGAATLLYSLTETSSLPEQTVRSDMLLRRKDAIQALIGGVVAGGLTAILPGVGAAHAAVIGMLFASGTGDHGFLILTGAIGTTNFFLSLAAYDAIEKARNGALLAATTISPDISLATAIGAALFAGGFGVIVTTWIGARAVRWLRLVPYKLLTLMVLCFVTALVLALSGWWGLLVYAVGAAIGLLPAASKAARAHAMSCILIPVAVRFIVG